jgi:hypothetical protein
VARFSPFLQGDLLASLVRYRVDNCRDALPCVFLLAFCVGIAYDHFKNDKESIWARTVRQPKHERRSDENVNEPLQRHFFCYFFFS